MAPEIREFTCKVPQEKIDRLHKRLDEVEFPTELEDGPGWDYGSPMYSESTAATNDHLIEVPQGRREAFREVLAQRIRLACA
jgi:hypothetical protein